MLFFLTFFTVGFVIVVQPLEDSIGVVTLLVLVPDDLSPPIIVDTNLSVQWV